LREKFGIWLNLNGRGAQIRTEDPLLPKQIPAFWLNY